MGGERFVLRNHGAQPPNRYDYLRDVQRLEREVATGRAKRQFAILLANDHRYWNPPQQSRRTITDEAFRIHERRELGGELAWLPSGQSGNNEWSAIADQARAQLPHALSDCSKPGAEEHAHFHYLAISVG